MAIRFRPEIFPPWLWLCKGCWKTRFIAAVWGKGAGKLSANGGLRKICEGLRTPWRISAGLLFRLIRRNSSTFIEDSHRGLGGGGRHEKGSTDKLNYYCFYSRVF